MDAWIFNELLPGWQASGKMSTLDYLLLTVIGPVALGLVIMVIGLTPKMMKRSSAEAQRDGIGSAAPAEHAELATISTARHGASEK